MTLTWIQPNLDSTPPTARVSSSSCLVGSKIYFFGGYDGHNWLNDLHVLDAENLRWQHPKIFGELPHPRCRHTANLVYGKMLVFGGNDVDTSYNDLYFLPISVQVPESDL